LEAALSALKALKAAYCYLYQCSSDVIERFQGEARRWFFAEPFLIFPNPSVASLVIFLLLFSQNGHRNSISGADERAPASAQSGGRGRGEGRAGAGIVNDSTYRQNPLVRLLERLVIF